MVKQNGEIAVEMKHITKKFGNLAANNDINLKIYKGQVHCLLGENGAGKSTLMNVLTGLYKADCGEIEINGQPANIHSPKDAIGYGIGMVHQHFRLVKPLTVLENIILGSPKVGFWLNNKAAREEIMELTDRYDLHIDLDAKVESLSVGEQQRTEIIKQMYRGANIMILDEPTAVLTPEEAEKLFVFLRQTASAGKTIIFISHKLREIMSVGDKVTIMRKGQIVGAKDVKDTSVEDLAGLMIEGTISEVKKQSVEKDGAEVLRLTDIYTLHDDSGNVNLENINLCLNEGEICGIAGVSGNGQRELAEVVSGLRFCDKGEIIVGQKVMTNQCTRKFIQAGVSHIPEDRLGTGLAAGLSIIENGILKEYKSKPISVHGLINYKVAKKYTEEIIEQYKVKAENLNRPISALSGGNLQRMIIGREINGDPKILVAAQPTRGIDIAGVKMVHSMIFDQKAKGVAVLFISEDLDEIMEVCDTLAVMYQGHLSQKVRPSETTIEEIGLRMGGALC